MKKQLFPLVLFVLLIVSSAGTTEFSVSDDSAQGVLPQGALPVADRPAVSINVKEPPAGFAAAAGDGITDNRQALQDLFDYAVANDLSVFFPPGIYLVDPTPSALRINLTASGQNFRVVGAGSGSTVIKQKPGTVKINGRYSKLLYCAFDMVIDAGVISFEGLTFDKSGASNGSPPSEYAWEQAHCFSIATSAVMDVSRASIKEVIFRDIEIRDKVGAGIHTTLKCRVGSYTIENVYETGFSGLFGERGDIELNCYSESLRVVNSRVRFMQLEEMAGFETTAEKPKRFDISDSTIDVLQMGAAPTGHVSVVCENIYCAKEFSVRGVNAMVKNSTLKFRIQQYAPQAVFDNCRILIPYNDKTQTSSSIDIGKKEAYNQKWRFTNCLFELDDPSPSTEAKGAAFAMSTMTTGKKEVAVTIEGCSFDGRLESAIYAYGKGAYCVSGSRVACWGSRAFVIGGYDKFAGFLYLKDNDYSGISAESNLVSLARNNARWALQISGTMPVSQYRISSSGSGSEALYSVRPRLYSDSMPAEGYFFKGDLVYNTDPSGAAGWLRRTTGATHALNTDWVIYRKH